MDIFWFMVAYLVISAVLDYFSIGYDDSDNKELGLRSNLKVPTDYKTGVQYLSTIGGGITPRLDKGGNIVVIKGLKND